jgi:hypothetical protein
MLNGAVWAPLVFMYLLRVARGVRPLASAVLAGTCLGVAWLSGHHQIPIFLTLAAAGIWIFLFLRHGAPDWKIAFLAAVSFVFEFGAGALQILPAREFGKLALRWVSAPEPVGWDDKVPYSVHATFSLHPVHLFGILMPGLGESVNPFIGVAAFALAGLGVALAWKSSEVKMCAALAAASVAYAVGENSVFQGFIYAVFPLVEKARTPAHAIAIFGAAAAVLAAFGVDFLFLDDDSPWKRRVQNTAAGFSIALGLTLMAILYAKRMEFDFDNRPMIAVLSGLALAALIYGWRSANLTRAQAMTMIALLVIFELGNEAGYQLVSSVANPGSMNFINQTVSNADIAAFLHSKPGPFRVETDLKDLGGNWGDYHDVDFTRAYEGVTINAFNTPTDGWNGQLLAGVRYFISKAPMNPSQREVFQGSSGLKVFENPEAFPRAWTVHRTVRYDVMPAAQAFMAEHHDELRTAAVVAGDPPQVSECDASSESARIVRYNPERVDIDAVTACQGLLILSDTYYPGWKATIDGNPAEIREVDISFRAVVVPRGFHRVTYLYRPQSVMWGGLLTFLSIAGALLLSRFR